MSTKELLQLGKKVIEDPNNWIKGHYAQDKSGKISDPSSEDATCFCSLGALYKAAGDQIESMEVYQAERILNHLTPRFNVVNFNDDPNVSHDQVMGLWDEAIKRAEEKESQNAPV